MLTNLLSRFALGGVIDILPQTVEGKQRFSAGVLEMLNCLGRKHPARQLKQLLQNLLCSLRQNALFGHSSLRLIQRNYATYATGRLIGRPLSLLPLFYRV